ncbi:MAG: serpin family protein [Mediterranea massiliensis]|nr:serpin family protein [Mediterranea massiliensis]
MKKHYYFIRLFVFIATIAFMLPACNNNDTPIEDEPQNGNQGTQNGQQKPEIEWPKTRIDIELTEAEKLLAKQHVDFSIRLLQAAEETTADKSQIILSPLSASFALSMVTNGAAGETQQELLNALGFNGFTAEEMNTYNRKLITALTDLDNTSPISIANSLWLNKGFTPKDSFKKTLTNSYDAEVQSVDFANSETVERINEWCEKKTNGCIPDFLKTLLAEQRFVLLNALYFKGRWQTKFGNSQPSTFTTEEGKEQEVTFLSMEETKYLYAENELFSMAELPYGNGAYGLLVLLPKEEVKASDCLVTLNGEQWLKVVSNMKPTLLNLKLPKFKVEAKQSLIDALKVIGIRKAFTTEADFTALSEKTTFISGVLQGNYLSIDENGTEAAAVTIIGVDGDTPPTQSKVIDFYAKRPFFYFLKEKSTNTILFMGKMGRI